MLKDLAGIALYLNLATAIIDKEGGSLEFLTGNSTDTVKTSYSKYNFDTQETQCLKFGSKLWIANNDDDESTVQKLFLEKLGLNRFSVLLAHVKKYGTRVLTHHQGTLTYVDNKYKERLLKELLFPNATQRQDALSSFSQRAGINEYKLTAQSGSPPEQSIVFIKGSYEGTDTFVKQHAEQKLMGAFGKYLEHHATVSGKFYISGCKGPCSTCGAVLKKLYDKLIKLRYKYYVELFYDDSTLTVKRESASLRSCHTYDIRSLDIDKYYSTIK